MHMDGYDFEWLCDVLAFKKIISEKCYAFNPICPTSFFHLFRESKLNMYDQRDESLREVE